MQEIPKIPEENRTIQTPAPASNPLIPLVLAIAGLVLVAVGTAGGLLSILVVAGLALGIAGLVMLRKEALSGKKELAGFVLSLVCISLAGYVMVSSCVSAISNAVNGLRYRTEYYYDDYDPFDTFDPFDDFDGYYDWN